MANHKRRRPKDRRAGCLLCKPWKINGFAKTRLDAERFSDHRRRKFAEGEIETTQRSRPPTGELQPEGTRHGSKRWILLLGEIYRDGLPRDTS